MIRALTIALFVLGLLTVVPASKAVAHDGHPHTLMGTLTMAAPDHVMMKLTTGRDATVLVNADTKVTRNEESMKVEDIKAGTRIVITAITEGSRTTATEIQVGAEPTS